VVENSRPYTPFSPSPIDHAVIFEIDTILSWSGGDPNVGDTVTYDVYFGTSNKPQLVASGQTDTSYDPGTLIYDTNYYWKIVSEDNHGETTEGPLWRFTTIRTKPMPWVPLLLLDD
jgi:hypothetical protein